MGYAKMKFHQLYEVQIIFELEGDIAPVRIFEVLEKSFNVEHVRSAQDYKYILILRKKKEAGKLKKPGA